MQDNKVVNQRTEDILVQVSEVTDKLYTRVKGIDFEKEDLTNSDLNDMRLHLGYTKNYSDLAKVRLAYLKVE